MFDLETHIVHMKDVKNQKECFFISAELGQRCADALQGGLPMLGPASQLPAHISPCLGPDGKTFAYVLSRELWNEVKYDLRSGEKELFFKARRRCRRGFGGFQGIPHALGLRL